MEKITKAQARNLWLRSQRLDRPSPFGRGPQAALAAVEHLGYVQIDTISVIERCHHHILFSRIPDYRKNYLHQLQTMDKSIFEYWTHALAYVPTKDYKFFMKRMKSNEKHPALWYKSVSTDDLKRVIAVIKKNGALSIRDFKDEVLVDKEHEWSSRKPSKKALQLGFTSGKLVINERLGMLKKYEIAERHFNWKSKPVAATEREILSYKLDRALRTQGCVSLESVCYLEPSQKKPILNLIENEVSSKNLVPVTIAGVEKIPHWVKPMDLEQKLDPIRLVHILSPFDPLIIQRKRLHFLFEYQHLFEAYVPVAKRKYGYFSLPVLIGDQVAAVLDLKTDREQKKMLIQKWIPLSNEKSYKKMIEATLNTFEKFQLS